VLDVARAREPRVGQARTVVQRILAWYDHHARDLPWRRPDATPWAIMVSEFMLQQTPVERVLGPWHAWLERWPTPAALAAASPGEAVRAVGSARLSATSASTTSSGADDHPEIRRRGAAGSRLPA
jgi:hypothetical protein